MLTQLIGIKIFKNSSILFIYSYFIVGYSQYILRQMTISTLTQRDRVCLINTQRTGDSWDSCYHHPFPLHCWWPLQLKVSQAVSEGAVSTFFHLLRSPHSLNMNKMLWWYHWCLGSEVGFMWNPPIHSSFSLGLLLKSYIYTKQWVNGTKDQHYTKRVHIHAPKLS